MEAFILADRVVTKQHMDRLDHKQLKYLKRYDLPMRVSRKREPPANRSKMKENKLKTSYPFPAQKVKNLLSTITEGFGGKRSPQKSPPQKNFERYFSYQSDPSKNVWEVKKTKETLLIRPIQPQAQHYDALFDPVSHRSPCWTFTPHNRQIGLPQKQKNDSNPLTTALRSKTAQKFGGQSRKQGYNRGSEGQQWVLQKAQRKFYEQMRERSGLQHEHQERLQYWPQELGRSTVQIFKKYHLTNDAYFKKFLADLQNIQQ